MRVAVFDRFKIEMPQDCVDDCSHQGSCDDDVEFWMPKLKLDHISEEDARAELKEYGAWEDSELQNHQTNLERLVWIGAGNIREDGASV